MTQEVSTVVNFADHAQWVPMDDDWLEELEWLERKESGDLQDDEDEDGMDLSEEGDGETDNASSAADSTSLSEKSKPKRKRIRPKRKRKSTVVVPRLFKRDIRRHYAAMMANVTNSHDYNLFYAFFRTYSVENLVMKRQFHNGLLLTSMGNAESNSLFPSRMVYNQPAPDIHGVLSFINAMYLTTKLHPDQVISVEDVQVVTRTDSARSKVMFKTKVDFTLMYDIHPISFVEHMFESIEGYRKDFSVSGLIEDAATSSETEIAPRAPFVTLSTPPIFPPQQETFMDPFDYYQSVTGNRMPLRANPLPVALVCESILHLDEERRISCVEVTGMRFDL